MVDDEAPARELLASYMEPDYQIVMAQSGSEALEKAKARHRLSIHKNKGHMRVTEDVIKESLAFIEEIGKNK